MLDPIYHRALKLFCYPISCVKNVRFYHLLRNIIMDIITLRY